MKSISASLYVLIATGALAGCGGDQSSPATVAAESESAEHADEDSHSGEGVIRLTEQQLTDAEIELATAGSARIRETLPLYGRIVPNAAGVRQVTARFPGVMRSVTKNFGDSVRQGETLAVIESNESLQRYDVVSPIGGVVIARDANLGEQTGDRVLFTVADLSSVWVEMSLFPRDVGKVGPDQIVVVRGADDAARAEGRVIWVAPFGSSENQTLTARVLLDNANRRWAPGLYVTAEVTLNEADVPIAIRNEALQTLEEQTVVFVRDADGFEPRPVRLGRRDADNTEVTSGLAAGDTYVARNSFTLKAELGKGEAEHAH
jgi:cobalt-zinc-cadmium efflux system membrane fusion protein